jgi:hypothetical protein
LSKINGRTGEKVREDFMRLSQKQIETLGDEYIKDFGTSIAEILDRQLTKKHGKGWFEITFKTPDKNKANALKKAGKKDPYTLIHQIVKNKNNDYRAAIASEFKLPNSSVSIHDPLTTILDLRNKWAHPNDEMSLKDLLSLLDSIYLILGNRNHVLGDRCEELIKAIRDDLTVDYGAFSSAFGNEFRKSKRSIELLQDALRAYRIEAVERFEGLKIEDLNTEISAELISAVRTWQIISAATLDRETYWLHNLKGEELNLKLSLFLSDLFNLFNLFDLDIFISDPKVFIQLDGETLLKKPKSLTKNQMIDLVKAYFTHLSTLVNQVVELRNEMGIANCVCFYCCTLDQYGFPVGYVQPQDLLTGSVMDFFANNSFSESLSQMFDESFQSWMQENNYSKDLIDSIFLNDQISADPTQ